MRYNIRTDDETSLLKAMNAGREGNRCVMIKMSKSASTTAPLQKFCIRDIVVFLKEYLRLSAKGYEIVVFNLDQELCHSVDQSNPSEYDLSQSPAMLKTDVEASEALPSSNANMSNSITSQPKNVLPKWSSLLMAANAVMHCNLKRPRYRIRDSMSSEDEEIETSKRMRRNIYSILLRHVESATIALESISRVTRTG
ncbi:hypothetical protein Cni_G28905 [Canna indica]|uniref:Uncharacterized protein n=1 Tax=Canna indica TaxID=4628 RepID=A0AAQ3L3M1_9LILI|nr:hypothetical protein Cni_G28905 [Canna indica]